MRRSFSVEEANALVPRLERDMTSIQKLLSQARALRREQEMIKSVGYLPDGRLIMSVDYEQAETKLKKAVYDLNRMIDALHAEGCIIKDIEHGLVDFPATIEGHDVYLCWKLGEKRIRYYHDVRSGYSGRIALHEDDLRPDMH